MYVIAVHNGIESNWKKQLTEIALLGALDGFFAALTRHSCNFNASNVSKQKPLIVLFKYEYNGTYFGNFMHFKYLVNYYLNCLI